MLLNRLTPLLHHHGTRMRIPNVYSSNLNDIKVLSDSFPDIPHSVIQINGLTTLRSRYPFKMFFGALRMYFLSSSPGSQLIFCLRCTTHRCSVPRRSSGAIASTSLRRGDINCTRGISQRGCLRALGTGGTTITGRTTLCTLYVVFVIAIVIFVRS